MLAKLISGVWSVVGNLKTGVIIAVLVVAGVTFMTRECNSRRREATLRDQLADASLRLATSQDTIEIQKGLYAEKVAIVEELELALLSFDATLSDLTQELSRSRSEVLTANSLAVKWKKAYEGALEASQTDVDPPSGPDGTVPPDAVVRKRVDFSGDFGYIGVTGHTLTDPPEGWVSVVQLRPLRLTIVVARGKDNVWSSYVKSSEENVEVDVELAGIDPGVAVPKRSWRDALKVEVSAPIAGDYGAGLGVRYDFGNASLGTGCTYHLHGGGTCSISMGFGIFR